MGCDAVREVLGACPRDFVTDPCCEFVVLAVKVTVPTKVTS